MGDLQECDGTVEFGGNNGLNEGLSSRCTAVELRSDDVTEVEIGGPRNMESNGTPRL